MEVRKEWLLGSLRRLADNTSNVINNDEDFIDDAECAKIFLYCCRGCRLSIVEKPSHNVLVMVTVTMNSAIIWKAFDNNPVFLRTNSRVMVGGGVKEAEKRWRNERRQQK